MADDIRKHETGNSHEPPPAEPSRSSSGDARDQAASALTELQTTQDSDMTVQLEQTAQASSTTSGVPPEAALSPTMRDVAAAEDPAARSEVKSERGQQQNGSVFSSQDHAAMAPVGSDASAATALGDSGAAALSTVATSTPSEASAAAAAHPLRLAALAASDSTTEAATGATLNSNVPDSTVSDSAAGNAAEVDGDGLTALQRHALEQSSDQKEKGVSCHQCKTTKDGSVLLFCVNRAEKGRRKRSCRKKYCDACLRRAYNVNIEALTPAEIEDWLCPACQGKCVCAACTRKVEVALQNSQKLAAAAALQNAFLPHLAGFPGFPLALLNSRPNMALMQMQMAAAAAASMSAAAASPPVPAIVASGPPPVAQEATTLASTTDLLVPGATIVPHAAQLGLVPPPLAQPTGPYTFAPPPVSTGAAVANVAAPQESRQPQSLLPPQPQQQHPHSFPPLQHQIQLLPDPAQPQDSPSRRARAYSCPVSPAHAAALPVPTFAFPPPPAMVSQQSNGASPSHPTHPKHAGSSSQLIGSGAPAHPPRTLDMQPSYAESSSSSRTTAQDVSASAPHRRRRHSLKPTPLGTSKGSSRPRSSAASKQTSRTNSPRRNSGDTLSLHYQQSQAQQYVPHQDAHADFSLPGAFSQSVSFSTMPRPGDQPFSHGSQSQHQRHSAPASPSPRNRRGSFSASSASYSAGMHGGSALPAIALSVNANGSAQSSPVVDGGARTGTSSRRSSGQEQMLISPLQQQQLQHGSPFNLGQQQSQQSQQQPQLGSNGQLVHMPHQLYHSPNHLFSHSMLVSPQQQPQPHASSLGFQVSPHVSPQSQFQPQHSMLSSFMQHQQLPHQAMAYVSPTQQQQQQQRQQQLGTEFDMLQAQALLDGAPALLESSTAAAQTMQRLILQQQQLSASHRLNNGADPTHDLHLSMNDTAARLDAINQLQQTLQSVINAKTGENAQLASQQLFGHFQSEQVNAFNGMDGVGADLLHFQGGGDVGAGVPPPSFDPFATQDLAASAPHDPPSFGSDQGAPGATTFTFTHAGQSPTQQQLQQLQQQQALLHQSHKFHTPLPFLNTDEDGRSPTHQHSLLQHRPAAAPFPGPSPPLSATSGGLSAATTFQSSSSGEPFDAHAAATAGGGGSGDGSPSALLAMPPMIPDKQTPTAQAEFAAFS